MIHFSVFASADFALLPSVYFLFMATLTLEDTKTEEEPPVREKEELKAEENKQENQETDKGEKNQELPVEVVSRDTKELEETLPEDEARESEEEKEPSDKATPGRKGSSKEDQVESKKESPEKRPGQESAEKKEPATPATERPTRERKSVDRYTAPSVVRSSSSKTLSIEKGRGAQLKEIPNVAFKLSKRKPDDNLQVLHSILFGKKAKAHNLKRNIGQFSGFVWIESEEEKQRAKVKEKLDKCVKDKLMDFCDVLNIPISKSTAKKEELSSKLLQFLELPQATTHILLADMGQKGRKRKVAQSKNVEPGEASDMPPKRQKQTHDGEKQRDLSQAEEEDKDDDKVESTAANDSHEDDYYDSGPKEESDHEDSKSEEDEPKGRKSNKDTSSKKAMKESSGAKPKDHPLPAKTSPPAKSVKGSAKSTRKAPGSTSKQDATDVDGTSASVSKSTSTKKQKVEKESQKEQPDLTKVKDTGRRQSNKSTVKTPKNQAKGKATKKAKSEPSRAEIHAVVVDILKEVDFNTATLSDILRQLGTHFGLDLMHRKAEVKDIITDVISNMSDKEDDEEDEASDDRDKDGDEDDA